MAAKTATRHLERGDKLARLQHRKTAALKEYQAALDLEPHVAEAHWRIGQIRYFARRKELAAALTAFEAAVEARPDWSEGHLWRANALAELGRLAEVEDSYREAIRLRPEDTRPHISLGLCLPKMGRHAEAIACYREGLRLGPAYGEMAARLMLADAYKENGQIAEAVSEWRIVAETKPVWDYEDDNSEEARRIPAQYDTERRHPVPAKGRYREPVVRALEKDGWTLTDDPLTLALFGTDLMIDLGAERVLAAEREGRRIAVEVKSFLKPSAVQDLKEAAGQFVPRHRRLYGRALQHIPAEADRLLYLAIREATYLAVFEGGIGRVLLDRPSLRLIVFDEVAEEVLRPYAERRYANGDITNEAVFDRAGDHYLIVSVGWQGYRRVAHNLLHLDLIGGKVWIQKDGTEDGIAAELEAAGIPQSDIVLALHRPEDRALIPGYAAA